MCKRQADLTRNSFLFVLFYAAVVVIWTTSYKNRIAFREKLKTESVAMQRSVNVRIPDMPKHEEFLESISNFD